MAPSLPAPSPGGTWHRHGSQQVTRAHSEEHTAVGGRGRWGTGAPPGPARDIGRQKTQRSTERGQGGLGKRDVPGCSPRDQRTEVTRHQQRTGHISPLWQRRGKRYRTDGGGGLSRATEGPEAIHNDPEVRQLPRPRHRTSLPEPPAEERSPGTPDASCLSWPPWAPSLGARAHHHQHPEPQLAPGEHSLGRVLSPPRPSQATCSAQLPPQGTESLLCPETPPAMEAREGRPT